MYRCPHCKALSLTAFSPGVNGRAKCPACGTELKLKVKFSTFLLVIVLLAIAILGPNGIHIDITTQLLIVAATGLIQLLFLEFVVADPVG